MEFQTATTTACNDKNSIRTRPSARYARHNTNDECSGKGDVVWDKRGEIGTFTTPWMTLVGELLLDNNGKELEYWRVQKDDSVVILTCQYDEDDPKSGAPRLACVPKTDVSTWSGHKKCALLWLW
jgi:hypothetical protein